MKNERVENYFFIGSIIIAAALVALIFLPELNAIVLGFTFMLLFEPLHRWLLRRMPHEASAAALIILFISIVIVLAPLVFFGFQIFGEAQNLYTAASAGGTGSPVLQAFEFRLHEFAPGFNLDINTYLRQGLGVVVNNFGAIFSGITAVLGTVFLSFFALYYFLRDGGKMHDVALAKSPLSRERTAQLLEKLHAIMSAIIRGTLLVAAIYGILVGLGFFIFGLPSGMLWGGVAAFASFIPMVGVFLVMVPGILVLFAEGHIGAALGLLIWMGLMSVFVENWLRPRLIGQRVDIHPLLILFSVLGGLSFFGPLGLLLGPLALGLLLSLLEIYPVLAQK